MSPYFPLACIPEICLLRKKFGAADASSNLREAMAGFSISQEHAEYVAEILNLRGFIISADDPMYTGRYVLYSDFLTELEEELRDAGYSGGPLMIWTTGFRGSGCDYGVVDTDLQLPNALVDAYCLVTDHGVEAADITGHQLSELLLGILFVCPTCGREGRIDASALPDHVKRRPAREVRVGCTACGESGILPSGVFRTFRAE